LEDNSAVSFEFALITIYDVSEPRHFPHPFLGALKEAEATPVPEIVIQKYNQFVDRIYERINKVLRKSYDPVTVHLTTSADNKPAANKTKKTNKNKKQVVVGHTKSDEL
jgi:hypothetical protein